MYENGWLGAIRHRGSGVAGPWCANAAPAADADRFMPISVGAVSTTEALSRWVAPIPVILTNLVVVHTVAMATDTITYTIRVNGVDTALTVTIPSGQTTATVSGSIWVMAGIVVTMKIRQNGTEANTSLNARAAVSF